MSRLEILLLGVVAVGLVLTIAAGVAHTRARARLAALERTSEQLRTAAERRAALEQDRRLVRLFLRELSPFMRTLHGAQRVREIPSAILAFVERIFEPRGAAVLMRRSPARSDPDKEHQVITVASAGNALPTGTVLRSDSPILARVFEAGRTLHWREVETSPAGRPTGSVDPADFRPDLASPMWVDGEILGAVALSQPSKALSDARYLLELVAQTGAVALSSARSFSRIRSAADMDALTGILNRGALTYLLEEVATKAIDERSSLSIFLFDIDHFKNYNDVNGHVAGDELLRLLPGLVAENVRADDTFGRYGGEEFLLILPGRSPQEALGAAEKIRSLIEEQDFPFGDRQPLGKITISGGVATLPDHADNAVDLLRAADTVLYEAKQAGRNRVRCAEDTRRESYERLAAEDVAADEADDLKRIRGIGPTFEKALHGLGITRYRQLADLNWQQMILVATHLKTTPERIVRDRWMKQARRLDEQKSARERGERSATV